MNECILVVDDDREIVKAIAILLEKEDYRVLRAYDGMEALDILAGNQVQLLIIDVMMPRLVKLTATETKIMELFMRNLGRVFPAEEIYRRVWDEEAYAPENTVMVHIRRIREKIELNPKEPEYLKVVWGIGYKMEKK